MADRDLLAAFVQSTKKPKPPKKPKQGQPLIDPPPLVSRGERVSVR